MTRVLCRTNVASTQKPATFCRGILVLNFIAIIGDIPVLGVDKKYKMNRRIDPTCRYRPSRSVIWILEAPVNVHHESMHYAF